MARDGDFPPDLATLGLGVFSRRNPPIDLPAPPLHPALLTVKLTLDDSKPPIWRRLDIRGDLTLDRVHGYLQAAMGWTDSHLHRFEPGPDKHRWQAPYFVTEFDIEEGDDEGTPETDARLDQLLRGVGDRLFYTYDFGDDWAHTITVEAIRPATAQNPPALCRKAIRACPQEDVGGIGSWNDLIVALGRVGGDPRRLKGDHEMYADWLPADVDPAEVDLDGINLMISLVGASADELLARLRAEGIDLPSAHPAYVAVLDKAPVHLEAELAALFGRAIDPEGTSASDEQLAALLRPWQTLLEVAGADGIPLTKAGWMAPAACERIWTDGGLDHGIGKGNREQHTPELAMLRQDAVQARLVRTYRGRLVRTKLGDKAVRDVEVLAAAVANSLLRTREASEADERVITLLLIASGFQPDHWPRIGVSPEAAPAMDSWVRKMAMRDEVARLMTALGWRVGNGPVLRDHTRGAAAIFRTLTLADSGPRGSHSVAGPAARHLARLALTSRPA